MAKEKKDPNHYLGKRTGYSLIDGVYHIAPIYQDSFAFNADRKRGVDTMVRAVVAYAAETHKEIATSNRKLWDEICADLGLERGLTNYTYYPDGTVHAEKRETEAIKGGE